MGLADILGGPVKGLLSGVTDLLGKFITTDKDRMAAQVELLQLQGNLQLEMAKLDAATTSKQAEVVIAEANGHSWMQRNWRPIFALTLVSIIFFNYLVSPIFHLAVLPTPDRLWDLMELCLGGYIGGRTVEKVAPSIISVLKDKSK